MTLGSIRILATALVIALAAPATAADWTDIRIGTEGAYAPFSYVNADGDLAGFEIDLAKAVCAKLEASCTFVVQDWAGMIPALLDKKFDVIMASMSITDERRAEIDFTRPYYHSPAAFVAPRDTTLKGSSTDDLANTTVGAQLKTIQAAYLEDKYQTTDIKLFPTQAEVNFDLLSGRIDALFVDKLAAVNWLDGKDGQCCKLLGNDIDINDDIGAGVRKEDSDLRDRISGAIDALKADGTYDKINAKYFSFSIWPG